MSKHYKKPAQVLTRHEAARKRDELIEALSAAWNYPPLFANVSLYYEKNGKAKHIAFKLDQDSPEFMKFLHDYCTQLIAQRGMDWAKQAREMHNSHQRGVKTIRTPKG